MRTRIFTFAALMTALVTVSQAQQPADPVQLPTRRVVLYKSGVGYFEHVGNVTGSREVAVQFTSSQLDDVLKSLMALDLDNGTISAINYNSVAPIAQRLRALRMPMGTNANPLEFYNALRGAQVEVTAPSGATSGRLLSVERRSRLRGEMTEQVDTLTIVSDAGAVRTIEMGSNVSIRVGERGLRQDISRYLEVVASGREQDVRRMVLNANGTGTRRLFVSYISEVPVWKSTYRLVLPEDASEKPRLQGWAIIDNTVGDDWNDVELSLVAGAPQSFLQPISQPYYLRRPAVPMMPGAAFTIPQTHTGAIQAGPGTARGVVRDTGGSVLPGVAVRLLNEAGQLVASAVTSVSGEYQMQAPAGSYRLTVQLPGFNTESRLLALSGGDSISTTHQLQVGAASETITVTGSAPGIARSGATGVGRGTGIGAGEGGSAGGGVYRPGGVVGGVAGGIASPSPAPLADAQSVRAAALGIAAASAQDMGDLFEYRVDHPVTIRKDQSALVPIVNAPIDAERVSVWVAGSRPLRALWITNTTNLTLDSGTFSVVDARAFAGEGLMDSLKPAEKRLISYGSDLAVRVDARQGDQMGHFTRVVARAGVVTSEREERSQRVYRVRNEDTSARTVIIEHPLRAGWTLADGPQPVETTSSVARFRLPVGAKGEATLTVTERTRSDSNVAIGTLNDQSLQIYAQGGISIDAIRKALQPLRDKQDELTASQRRLGLLQIDEARLTSDQDRLRQNLQALRGSREEKALAQRYVKDMAAQEDRLVTLRASIEAAAREAAAIEAAIVPLLAKLEFDLTGAPAKPGQ